MTDVTELARLEIAPPGGEGERLVVTRAPRR